MPNTLTAFPLDFRKPATPQQVLNGMVHPSNVGSANIPRKIISLLPSRFRLVRSNNQLCSGEHQRCFRCCVRVLRTKKYVYYCLIPATTNLRITCSEEE